jgi:cell division protein FtsW
MRIDRSSKLGVRRHKPDYLIVVLTGILMMLGLVVMYAIGPQRAQVLNASFGTDNYGSMYFAIKQAVSLALAIVVFIALANIPLAFFNKYSSQLVIVGIVACIVLAIAGATGLPIAQCSLGACRWFELGPLGTIQPAEFLKFSLLFFVAGFLAIRYKKGEVNNLHATLIPLGVITAVAVGLVIGLQKDMGTGIAIIAILLTMVFTVGINKRIGVAIIVCVIVLSMVFIAVAPHRMRRVAAFLQGDSATSQDAGAYHIAQAKIAIGSGGIFGVGIGNSVQATGYLPEAINDSVFAIMGETFGFTGLILILGIFAALLFRLLSIADHLPDMTMKLIVIGVFGWVASHVILNVAAMTGIFPLTGITLPLLSFGGTSMVFIAGALGLVFQLSRYTTNSVTVERSNNEDSRSRRGLGRPRHTNRSRA